MKNKKRYTFTLDEELVNTITDFLKPKGIPISGYINSLILENVRAIEVLQGVNSVKDLTIGKLTELYSDMVDEINKSKKAKKK